MSLFGKPIFDRACGASSKISFSDVHFKAPYEPNKPFHFQVAKNYSEAEFCQPWASEVCLNANLPPPPPPLSEPDARSLLTRWRTAKGWSFSEFTGLPECRDVLHTPLVCCQFQFSPIKMEINL